MRVLLIRSFYPEQKNKLETAVEKEKIFAPEKIKQIANELIFDLQRALSTYLADEFEVIDIFSNCEKIQRKWEKDFFPSTPPFISKALRRIKPAVNLDFYSSEDFYRILLKQVAFYSPEVIIVLPPDFISSELIKVIKEKMKVKIIGYHGATPRKIDFSVYDAFFSPFLPTVLKARASGIRAEYIPLAFEPAILEKLKEKNELKKEKQNQEDEKVFDVVFIGSFHTVHSSRKKLIEEISKDRYFDNKLHIFSQSYYAMSENLRKFYRGKAFGLEYYLIISKSKIVINHHGDILPWAHNLRLFETTGIGSFLITDNLPDISELFLPEKEIETFSDTQECIEKIKFYLEKEEKRKEIARSGQMRTLKEHTYEKRANEYKRIIRETAE
ncbi:Spore protein YkvP [bacterium HR19]|nr:Spore protein YkvP [bacterium HR19]